MHWCREWIRARLSADCNRARIQSACRWLLLCYVFSLSMGCSEPPGGGGIGGTGKNDVLYGEGLIVGAIEPGGEINGRTYDFTNARVTMDGANSDSLALKSGMFVSARVDHEAFVATSVVYQPMVTGPVQWFDSETNTITILGNQITYSTETSFDNLTPDDISAGTVLEISGKRTSSNAIAARYIGLKSMAATEQPPYFTVGKVEDVDLDMGQATLSGVVLDLSNLMQSPILTPRRLTDSYLTIGRTIRALIDPALYSTSTSAFSVRGLRTVNTINFGSGESIQISGLATQIADNSIVVDGVRIAIDSETEGFTSTGESLDAFRIIENEWITLSGITLTTSSAANALSTDSDATQVSASTQVSSISDNSAIYAIVVILHDRL